jgi:predicted aspartyl protease
MSRFKGLLLAVIGVGCYAGTSCGGGSSPKSNSTITPPTSGQNVVAISVNAGPAGAYANGAFVSVTVCVPSTSNCQTIPDILVDTGSSGLRIVSSALTISLPQQSASSGPVAECLPFISGYTWGPVQTADIQLGGEKASGLAVQVINENTFPVPSSCSSNGSAMDTVDTLGANGLLGIGLAPTDCPECSQSGSSNPGLYYACPSSGCTVISEPAAQQVANPVTLFTADNNGVILELPSVTAPEATLSGSLVFGIGTESNNSLGSATVYTTDDFGNFITTYKGQAYSSSFIDSGSNGYFFLDSATTGIPDCSNAGGFYCPSSTDNLSATNQGTNGSSGSVNFSVANADSLFSVQSDTVFGTLGGPGMDFDWGLPFFYGRNVFVAIAGKSTSGGTGPYWAY